MGLMTGVLVGVISGDAVGVGVSDGRGVKGVRVGMGNGVLEGVAVSRMTMSVAVGTAVAGGGVNVRGMPSVGSGTKAAEANVGTCAAFTCWQPIKNRIPINNNILFSLCNPHCLRLSIKIHFLWPN